MLMAVMDSILLYGCKKWDDALMIDKHRKQIASVQIQRALRESSYWKVPEPIALVTIDLLTQERKHHFERRDEIGGRDQQGMKPDMELRGNYQSDETGFRRGPDE